MLDCLIVGAGPAGLTAAIYLARFHLQVEVVDAGKNRAALIPQTRNHAGFPGGVSGKVLLDRMREQAAEFGVHIKDAVVEWLEHQGKTFHARVGDDAMAARSVPICHRCCKQPTPDPRRRPRRGTCTGLIRYCPICDGFEVTDRRVAVIGSQTRGYTEAVFLRMYTADVTLIAPDGALGLTAAERRHLIEFGIAMHDGPCGKLELRARSIVVSVREKVHAFDAVYPALRSLIRSECATGIGAKATKEGCLVVDDHQRTTIPGLYAAGDVAKGLDQISHAMGEAGVAATTIRTCGSTPQASWRRHRQKPLRPC